MKDIYILGIDTSCDETSAAITKNGTTVLSNIISSQIELHRPYGGVFPTVAKLAHQENILPVVLTALKRAHLTPTDLAAIAVTYGPGLAPALEVGLNFAKDFAVQNQLPFIGVNHLEGHLVSPLLTPQKRQNQSSQNLIKTLKLPALSIIISGGHTEFIEITNFTQYQILGQTLDDAAGECLDKIGRLLNLGYPAAPVVEKLAQLGDPTAHRFPLPLTDRHDFDLSFSGLKTFARNLVTKLEADQPLTKTQLYNLAASAQFGVFRHLIYKLEKLLHYYQNSPEKVPFQTILVGGGVAQNIALRNKLRQLARHYRLPILFPYQQKICGDNAAMIAAAAYLHYQKQQFSDPLTLERQPNLDF